MQAPVVALSRRKLHDLDSWHAANKKSQWGHSRTWHPAPGYCVWVICMLTHMSVSALRLYITGRDLVKRTRGFSHLGRAAFCINLCTAVLGKVFNLLSLVHRCHPFVPIKTIPIQSANQVGRGRLVMIQQHAARPRCENPLVCL